VTQKYLNNSIKSRVEKAVFSLSQFIVRMLNKAVMPFFLNLRTELKAEKKALKGPLIVIANHKSYFDPLIIAGSLPMFSSVYPLRFIAKDQLFQNSVSRLFFWILGCFPVFYGTGKDKPLELPSNILEEGGTVVFFPEAKCIREESLGEPKIGAGILALRFPEIPILPIAIHGSYRVGHSGWFKRAMVKSVIGQPFYLKDKIDMSTATPETAVEAMMHEITLMYEPMTTKNQVGLPAPAVARMK